MNIINQEVFNLPLYVKKIDVIVVESEFNVSQKYLEPLFSLFHSVNYYNDFTDIINFNKTHKPHVMIIDIKTKDLEIFSVIDTVVYDNPNIQIILYSEKMLNNYLYMKCVEHNVHYFINEESTLYDIKTIIVKAVENTIKSNKELFQDLSFCEIKDSICSLSCLPNSDIKLVAHYKGVPVIENAKVLETNGDKILIKVNNIHKHVFKTVDYAVISFLTCKSDIGVKVQDILVEDNLIWFDKPSFRNSYVHHRHQHRVVPCQNLNLFLNFSNKKYHVKIIDITLDHISLKVNNLTKDYVDNKIVDFNLEYKDKFHTYSPRNFSMQDTATIVKIEKIKDYSKVLLKLNINKDKKEIVKDYITERMKELIVELKRHIS